MKRVFGWLVVLVFGSLLVLGCAGLSGEVMKPAPVLVVTTPVVEMNPGAKVLMYGTGFPPKEEVVLLFKDAGGGLSGISGAVKPAPVPNAEGAWAVEWDCTAYLKMIKPGTAMITVADKDYKPVTSAPVLFVAAPKKADAKKK
jgi:hypothetical protein